VRRFRARRTTGAFADQRRLDCGAGVWKVKHVNDQATITLSVEEVDKDKALAASRVNQKMKQGLEIVKKADPQASLQTQGYYTYPVYPEEVAPPQASRASSACRPHGAWASRCR
jgi:uncharacterized protein YggE